LLLVKVSKIKNIPGTKADIDISATINPQDYDYKDLVFSSPCHFKGQMENKHGLINIRGEAKADMLFTCHRCCDSFSQTYAVLIDAYYSLQSEQLDLDGENDIYTFSGETIDITPEVLRQIFMEIPMKLLCREDCRGLCSMCGTNLNNGKCSCRDDDIDPRLEKLKEFVFDAEKGV
jgi:uncharacterized protein